MIPVQAPSLEPAFSLTVEVGKPLSLGLTEAGTRRMVAILGGELRPAPGISFPPGRVVPGGADVQLIRPNGDAVLDARYFIELEDGALIYVVNHGLRTGPADVIQRLNQGEEVDPALIYFRTTPLFETAAATHRWLTRHLFVATGRRLPSAVELDVFTLR